MKKEGKTGVSKSHPKIQKKVDRSLKESIKEGSFASVYNSLNTSYITPYALAMQATAAQVGILGAFATLVPAISQLGSCKLMEKYPRKKIVMTGIIIRTFMWIPIMLVSMLFFNNVSYTIWALIALVGLFYIISGFIHPAWFSLMGSLVPEKIRGSYFSKRNRYSQFFGVISMILSAVFLDIMKSIGSQTGEAVAYTFFGFFTLFTLGMLVRFYCAYLFTKHYEPKLKIRKKDHYKLKEFIKNLRGNAFGRFAAFNGAFRIAVGIASPFFAVYMLSQLNYSYTWYMIIILSGVMYQILFLRGIGRISDKFGNILLTKIATMFIALTPLVWAVSFFIPVDILQKLYLVFIAQLINGFGWGGFNLSMANYVYDSTKQERQGYALAYMNLFNGIGFFIGALFGSLVVDSTFLAINIFVAVFLISFIARALTVLIGSKYMTEVRDVKRYKAEALLHEIHPIRDALHEVHQFHPIKHPHSEKDIHHI